MKLVFLLLNVIVLCVVCYILFFTNLIFPAVSVASLGAMASSTSFLKTQSNKNNLNSISKSNANIKTKINGNFNKYNK